MATYLQGVTDYIPQIQPFSPDYNFYSGALDLKQSKYDAARKQLSNLYGSLLNAPLTRDDNTASRDKFFKTIEQDIQKMATMDLSLRQNQEAAAGIFNQLLDNKNIVKDMVWTKNFQSQVERSKGFKNCVDPAKCGGEWWEGGDRLLDYSRLEFKNASAEEAMYFGDAEYVPYQDITDKALKLAKEADLNVSIDKVTGQWITTTKNGPLIVKPLSDLMSGSIGKDPKVKEYYKAKSRLSRKDFMYSNKDQYGSLEAAEQAYIQKMTPVLETGLGIKEDQLEEEVSNNQKKQEKIKEKMNKSLESDKQTLEEVYNDLEGRKNAYDQTLEDVKNQQNVVKKAKTSKYTGEEIDYLYASFELGTDINNLAQTLAYKDYESSVKVNPYGLEAVKQANRMALEKKKFEYDIFKMDRKFEQEVALYESGYKGGGGGGRGGSGVPPAGTQENNMGEVIPDVMGGSDPGSKDTFSMANRAAGYRELQGRYTQERNDLSSNERAIVDEVFKRTKMEAMNGDVQAKEDYVKMVSDYMFAEGEAAGGLAGDVQEKSTFFDGALGEKTAKKNLMASLRNANTIDEKFALLQNYNLDLNKLQGEQVDAMYNSTVKGMYNMNDKANPHLRDYLDPIWQSTKDMRDNIAARDIALEQMGDYVASQTDKIAAGVAANWDKEFMGMSGNAEFWGDAIKSYVNQDGSTASEEEFVDGMVSRGHSEFKARSIYRGDKTKTWSDATTAEAANSVFESIGSWAYTMSGMDALFSDGEGAEGISQNLNEAAVGGKANYGIHDVYKRAFHEYADGPVASASAGLFGRGNQSAMATKYELDPAAYRSVATTGTIGFLKDALNNDNSVFSVGGFQESYMNSPEMKRFARLYLEEISSNSGKDRIVSDVTYANIAAGNKNKVAINIKVPERFSKKFKGSEENPGPTRGIEANLADQGFTIVMDRSATNNVFTQGAQTTAQEWLMANRGYIDFDQYPRYAKNLKLKAQDGKYVLSGSLMSGVDDNGFANYESIYPIEYSNTQDLNQILQQIDQIVKQNIQMNQYAEDEYLNSVK